MTKANDTEIYSILPYSIRNDQKVKDLCSTLDKVLMPLAEEAKMALVYSRIDVLPEDIIDLLAWQLHVDNWKDREARDGYLNAWCNDLDAELKAMEDDFVKYELPYLI